MKNKKKRYKHLSLEEREKLYALKTAGKSFREIAKKLERSHTTLIREWKRNAPYFQEYIPCKAHTKAQNRGLKQRRSAPLKNSEIFLYVRGKLRMGWSPETIAGRLSLNHPAQSIHHETIYRYIYRRENKKARLWETLVVGRKKRMKKEGRRPRRQSRIPDAVSIEQRPKVIERRNRAGHWETDDMESPKGDKTSLSVTVERLARYTLLSKMANQRAQTKTDVVVNRLGTFSDRMRKTLTADNGKENTYHKEVTAQLGMPVYFCHPYSSWEKGTVENTIGRVRRYLPKGTRLNEISKERIAIIEHTLNNTPRKCLGFLTPHEKIIELSSTKELRSSL